VRGANNMKAYIISQTHWDREWYQTFQNYRARLVGLLDEHGNPKPAVLALKAIWKAISGKR